ncbi:MAG: alpha/beta hydrolase family protein [Hyphomonas sp.]
MFFRVLRWIGLGLAAIVILLVGSSCTMLGLNYASLDTANKPVATPPINVSALVSDPAERARLKGLLQDTLYGAWPEGLPVAFGDWRVIVPDYLGGRGTLEEMDITIGKGEGARTFQLVAAFPAGAAQVPVVIAQTFGSNCATFPEQPVTSMDGDACSVRDFGKLASAVISAVFGEYIAEAPVGLYFDAGFAYASFHASDFVPDDRHEAGPAIAALGGEVNPGSTLMAWAYAFSAAVTALEADARIDSGRTAILGHSRHGKAALLAAAWDSRIDAVIAHQTGFGGAALSRSPIGERLDRLVKNYPHWMAPVAADYAADPERLPVDQHHLLALIAPRPLFLGNARRDVWSDPNSTYRAAYAASEVWRAYGTSGVGEDMKQFDPGAGISFFLRQGGHSVVDDDIEGFIAFLSAHLGAPRELPRTVSAP